MGWRDPLQVIASPNLSHPMHKSGFFPMRARLECFARTFYYCLAWLTQETSDSFVGAFPTFRGGRGGRGYWIGE